MTQPPVTQPLKKILSLQSHVAYGYVGNRAAVFPLQLLDFDVIAINTVQFSNHTGYGAWTGEICSPRHIAELLSGLQDRGVLDDVDAVLTGYLGDPALGDVILKTVTALRTKRPDLLYCCDPVMGDVGRGLFVRDTLPPFFQTKAVPAATILTPNQFELTELTGLPIRTQSEALAACRALHDRGPQIILLTSLETVETPPDTIQMMASHRNGRAWIVTTPKLPLSPAPNGAGDMTAALFTGHMIRENDPARALSLTANSVQAVFKATQNAVQRELALISAQDAIRRPESRYETVAL